MCVFPEIELVNGEDESVRMVGIMSIEVYYHLFTLVVLQERSGATLTTTFPCF